LTWPGETERERLKHYVAENAEAVSCDWQHARLQSDYSGGGVTDIAHGMHGMTQTVADID